MAETKEGKQIIYRVSDGTRHEHWPVDARAMLQSGEFSDTPPVTNPKAPAKAKASTKAPAKKKSKKVAPES